MSISEIFSNEWMKQFKLTTYTAEQVQVAMSDYEAKMNRINEIRTILGKQPEVVDLNWIAENIGPSEIINNYPGMVGRDLEKMERRLADHLANQ